MRKFVISTALGLLALAASFAYSQQNPQVPPKPPTAAQTQKILAAVKSNQDAQLAAQISSWNVQKTAQAVVRQVDETRKELGLDETWAWDWQTGAFVKQQPPPPPAAPPSHEAQPKLPLTPTTK